MQSLQEKVDYYRKEIKRLSPPRSYTDRVLLRIYQDMIDKYLKDPKPEAFT